MATKGVTITRPSDNVIVFTYAAMANGDDGVPISVNHADYADRQISVIGTLGAGGNLRVEATPDSGTTYQTLTDPQGNALDITTLKSEQIMEGLPVIRPRVTAGDGTTSLVAIITCRRPRSGRDGR